MGIVDGDTSVLSWLWVFGLIAVGSTPSTHDRCIKWRYYSRSTLEYIIVAVAERSRKHYKNEKVTIDNFLPFHKSETKNHT